jgi:hypothetical protein
MRQVALVRLNVASAAVRVAVLGASIMMVGLARSKGPGVIVLEI